jgi:hypothetical protein
MLGHWRLFERLILKRLDKFVTAKELVPKQQFCFLKMPYKLPAPITAGNA